MYFRIVHTLHVVLSSYCPFCLCVCCVFIPGLWHYVVELVRAAIHPIESVCLTTDHDSHRQGKTLVNDDILTLYALISLYFKCFVCLFVVSCYKSS